MGGNVLFDFTGSWSEWGDPVLKKTVDSEA
jgi:hypothetical protein